MNWPLAYSQERSAFGKTINKHQAVAFKLAEMAVQIETAKLMVYRAAWMKGPWAKTYDQASAMAKLYASDSSTKFVTTEAVQVHGGYGYVKEYHVERLMRDAKITQIYEGTTEIQKIVISRGMCSTDQLVFTNSRLWDSPSFRSLFLKT